jgi:hypothetical protein
MREDTKQRLERAIWLQRGKWVAMGLGVIVFLAGIMAFIARNAAQVQVRVPATIVALAPTLAQSQSATPVFIVKLADGKSVQVQATINANPKVGAQVEITEHQFANGNRTYTWN